MFRSRARGLLGLTPGGFHSLMSSLQESRTTEYVWLRFLSSKFIVLRVLDFRSLNIFDFHIEGTLICTEATVSTEAESRYVGRRQGIEVLEKQRHSEDALHCCESARLCCTRSPEELIDRTGGVGTNPRLTSQGFHCFGSHARFS